VVVAQYFGVLRHSTWAAETYDSQIVEYTYNPLPLTWDNREVVEIASLVNFASQVQHFILSLCCTFYC
jgi:hypothetical protein